MESSKGFFLKSYPYFQRMVCFLALYVYNIQCIFAYMDIEMIISTLEEFKEITGLDYQLDTRNINTKEGDEKSRVDILNNGKRLRFLLKPRSKVLPEDIASMEKEELPEEKMLLISTYISPKAKNLLRNKNISYVDTVGNAYMNRPELYIFIENGKSNRSELTINSRAFNKSGLKVLYLLLTEPEFLNIPYREIGKYSDVAIDTVSKTYKDILREKFIVKVSKRNYRFLDKERLFVEWVKSYNRHLRPKLRFRQFQWIDPKNDWKKMELPKHTYWGGESAAELLTEKIFASRFRIYSNQPIPELAKALKISPSAGGELTVVEKFWIRESASIIANPMLVYADLLFEGEPRLVEIANQIYKEFIHDQL